MIGAEKSSAHTSVEAACAESSIGESIYTMKKLIVLIPALPAVAMFLTSCTTVVKEPAATTTTTTHEEAVTRVPSTMQTTTTHSTTGGY
jgi:hypothetical protein